MGKVIIVRRTVEDLTPSDAEKTAEVEAEKRLELLGVVSCHSKKPPRVSVTREVRYGRGKTFHANIHSQKWKEYCDGNISISQLKASMAVEEGKAPVIREKPLWMLRLEQKAALERAKNQKPVLDV